MNPKQMNGRVGFLLVLTASFAHFIQKPYRDDRIVQLGLEHFGWLVTGLFLCTLFFATFFFLVRKDMATWISLFFVLQGFLALLQFFASSSQVLTVGYLTFASALSLSLVSLTMAYVLFFQCDHRGLGSLLIAQFSATILSPLLCIFITADGTPYILWLAALFSLASAVVVKVTKHLPAHSVTYHADGPVLPPVSFMGQTFAYTLVSVLLYYLLLEKIKATFEPSVRFTAFSLAELGSNALGLLGGILFADISNARKTKTRSVLPLMALLTFLVVGVSNVISFSVAFIIFFKVIKNSLRTTRRDQALLRTAPLVFIPSKNFLDTVVYRSGDLAGAWIIQAFNGYTGPIVLTGSFVALVWLWYSIKNSTV